MVKKNPRTPSGGRVTVTRPFYFDAIREVIAEGDLAKMKRVSSQAKEVLQQERDRQAVIKQLDERRLLQRVEHLVTKLAITSSRLLDDIAAAADGGSAPMDTGRDPHARTTDKGHGVRQAATGWSAVRAHPKNPTSTS